MVFLHFGFVCSKYHGMESHVCAVVHLRFCLILKSGEDQMIFESQYVLITKILELKDGVFFFFFLIHMAAGLTGRLCLI